MIVTGTAGLGERSHDVCIIGAGPIGIATALELGRAGVRVLLLESGLEAPTETAQALSDAEIAGGSGHAEMAVAVARRLGGTSNLWGGRCLPFNDIDFEERAILPGVRWPITRADIEPHFDAACDYAGCGKAVFEAADGELTDKDDRFTTRHIERWSHTPSLRVSQAERLKASETVELRLGATVAGARFAEDGRVAALAVADLDGARTDVPVRTVIVACGGLESARLLLNFQADAPERFGGPHGPLGRYYMGHLSGQLADIQIAESRTDAAFDFFNDGHGSFARRRFMPSEALQRAEGLMNIAFWPIMPRVSDPQHGSAVLSAAYLTLAFPPTGRMLVAEAIRRKHTPDGLNDVGRHLTNILMDLPRLFTFAPGFFWRRYRASPRLPTVFFLRNRSRRYALEFHAEQAPTPESRVTLTDAHDAAGLRRLRIDFRYSEADARSIVRSHELLADWLAATGLGRLDWRVPAAERHAHVLGAADGYHQIGTVRMGRTRAEGVVDGDLRSFDAPNLFVASSAVFPTSSQANPTLTAMALGVRLAARLQREVSGHNPVSVAA